jgi:small redox-active disulfide protein 2
LVVTPDPDPGRNDDSRQAAGNQTLKEDWKEEKMEIKVLGPGCQRCEQTKKNVEEAVVEAGIDAQIEKVTNVMEIAKYGVFGTPAVVVDGEVKSVGKIPEKEEIKKWIKE